MTLGVMWVRSCWKNWPKAMTMIVFFFACFFNLLVKTLLDTKRALVSLRPVIERRTALLPGSYWIKSKWHRLRLDFIYLRWWLRTVGVICGCHPLVHRCCRSSWRISEVDAPSIHTSVFILYRWFLHQLWIDTRWINGGACFFDLLFP